MVVRVVVLMLARIVIVIRVLLLVFLLQAQFQLLLHHRVLHEVFDRLAQRLHVVRRQALPEIVARFRAAPARVLVTQVRRQARFDRPEVAHQVLQQERQGVLILRCLLVPVRLVLQHLFVDVRLNDLLARQQIRLLQLLNIPDQIALADPLVAEGRQQQLCVFDIIIAPLHILILI